MPTVPATKGEEDAVDPAPNRAVRGPSRLLRGWAGALAMTLLAALFHAAASPGHLAPGVGVLATTVVLAAPLCTALAGRALSLWRTGVAVFGAQTLFHTVYGLSGGHHAVTLSPAAEAAHAGHGGLGALAGGPVLASTATVPGPEPALASGGDDLRMMLAHAAAALLTVAVLRWGERVVVAIAERVLEAARIPWVRHAPVVLSRPVRASVPRHARPVGSLLVLSTPGRRGPPFALAA